MRTLFYIVFLVFLLNTSQTTAQELTPDDQEKLMQAGKTADLFVERFRQTLNFGVVWQEFRAEQFGCHLIKTDLVTSVSDEEKMKFGIPLLERGYIALMNLYYLKGVHDLSIARMDSNNTEEQITPKEILKVENSSIYTKTNGKSPKSAKEIEEYIIELDALAKFYRKYMPGNVMMSAAWKANYKYLNSRSGVTHLGVGIGHPDFCITDDVKYYIVDKGIFYFYMIEEKGKIKVLALAVGN